MHKKVTQTQGECANRHTDVGVTSMDRFLNIVNAEFYDNFRGAMECKG